MKKTLLIAVVAGVTGFGGLSGIVRPIGPSVAQAAPADSRAELRKQIADIDDQIDNSRTEYYKKVADVGKGTPAAQKLEDAHVARIKDLQAQRRALTKKLGGVAAAEPVDTKALETQIAAQKEKIAAEKERHAANLKKLTDKDDIADENTRHTTRVKQINAHTARLEAELADFGKGKPKYAGGTLTEKIAEVDKQIADAQTEHEQTVTQINVTKHRIGQALQAQKGNTPAAAALRAQMSEQDAALVEENRSYANTMEDLEARQARLEALK